MVWKPRFSLLVLVSCWAASTRSDIVVVSSGDTRRSTTISFLNFHIGESGVVLMISVEHSFSVDMTTLIDLAAATLILLSDITNSSSFVRYFAPSARAAAPSGPMLLWDRYKLRISSLFS